MTKRAALYVRLSNAAEASTSLARQEADLRALAEREDWEVVAVLIDDGVSGTKARANAAEALRMIADDEADVLAVWKFDRWSRQGLSAVAHLIGTLDARPSALFVALNDGLRSDQSTWRIIAAILSEVARIEAENTSARVRSSMRALKHSGRFSGGVVPYGYTPAPNPRGEGRILAIAPREAAVIRELAERVLGGESLTKLVRDLNARQEPAPRSAYRRATQTGRDPEGLDRARWQLTSLTILLTGDALLGRVKHLGALVIGDNGLPAQVWDPILDLATLQRLRVRMGDPRATSTRPKRVKRSRVLSGLVYCDACGSKMHLNIRPDGRDGYRCVGPVNGLDCRGPAIGADSLEALVAERFLAMRGHEVEFEEIESVTDPGTTAELGEIEAALAEISLAMLDDSADVAALVPQLAALKNRRAELRERPATVSRSWEKTGRTLAEAWTADEGDVDARRALLAGAIDHVAISARVKRGPRFDPTRVAIRWHVAEDEILREDDPRRAVAR